jgi:hypothetical protein
MRVFAAVIALFLAVSSVQASPPGSTQTPPQSPQVLTYTQTMQMIQLVQRAEDLVINGDFLAANAVADQILAHPGFAAQNEVLDAPMAEFFGGRVVQSTIRGGILALIGDIKANIGEEALALELLDRAELGQGPADYIFVSRVTAHAMAEDWPTAARTMVDYTAAHPGEPVSEMSGQWARIAMGLEPLDERPLRRAFLEACLGLFRQTGEMQAYPWLRFQLAVMLLEDGDRTKARGLFLEERSASGLSRLRTERRFDFLRDEPDFESWTDIPAAVEAETARLRVVAAAEPDRLDAMTNLIFAELAIYRDEVALALAEATLLDLRAGERFAGQDWNYTWFFASLAVARSYAGDSDGGDAAFDEGLQSTRDPVTLGDMRGLYAEHLFWQGKWGRASAVLDAIDMAQLFSMPDTRIIAVQACNAYALGDRMAADVALSQLADRWEEDAFNYIHALYCAGRTQEIKALLVTMLASERHSADVIARGQGVDMRLPDDGAFAALHAYDEAWSQWLDDPDIRSAFEAVGRRESYAVRSLD